MSAKINPIMGMMIIVILSGTLLSAGMSVAQVDVATRTTATIIAAADDTPQELYKKAREALADEKYEESATMYLQLAEQYPESDYAGDALYWQAFALYRLGGTEDLNIALNALKRQRADHSDAATRGDAADLEARVYGVLAKRGDAKSMQWIARHSWNVEDWGEHDEWEVLDDWEEQVRWDEREDVIPIGELTRIRVRPELRVLEPLPPETVIRFREQEDDVRISALNALVQLNPGRAFSTLKKVLERRDEDSARLRRRAVTLLARTEGAGAGELLLDVVENDPDSDVRAEAVMWLSSVPEDKIVDKLEEIIRTSGDRNIQEMAFVALCHHPNPSATAVLKRLALDGNLDPKLREEAIMALRQKRSPEMLAFMMDLYDRLREDSLKDWVIVAIGEYGTGESRRWLTDLTFDRSQSTELRATALGMLAEDEGVGAPEFVRMYDTLQDREMKAHAISALGRRSRRADDRATDKLLDIARNEGDSYLREEAVSWLGHTEDERVFDVLEEIINE